MNKSLFVLILAALSLSVSGCLEHKNSETPVFPSGGNDKPGKPDPEDPGKIDPDNPPVVEEKSCLESAKYQCDGRTILMCNEGTGKYEKYDSCPDTCVIENNSPACYTGCSADDVGQVSTNCNGANSVSEYVCKNISDKYVYVKKSSRSCPNGCEDGDCVAASVQNKCETRYKCEGSNILECDDATGEFTLNESCDGVCVMQNNMPACYESCSKIGDVHTECDGSYEVEYVCKNESGQSVYVNESEKYCENGCMNGSCKTGTDIPVQKKCEEKYKCDGSKILECDENSGEFKESEACDDTCVLQNGIPACYKSCTPGSGDVTECSESYWRVSSCVSKSGQYVYETQSSSFCHNGCNQNGCITNQEEPPQKKCESEYKCDGSSVLKCNETTGDYELDSTCDGACVLEEGVPACYQKCSSQKVGDVIMECDGNNINKYVCQYSGTRDLYVYKFQSSSLCDNGCSEGACIPDPVKCETQFKCDGSTILSCNTQTGEYVASGTCDTDSKCIIEDDAPACYKKCTSKKVGDVITDCDGSYKNEYICKYYKKSYVYVSQNSVYCNSGCAAGQCIVDASDGMNCNYGWITVAENKVSSMCEMISANDAENVSSLPELDDLYYCMNGRVDGRYCRYVPADTHNSRVNIQEGQNCSVEQKNPANTTLRIHVIDVGNGDAIWIQSPTGQNVLIDSGDSGAFGVTAGGPIINDYLAFHGFAPGSKFDAVFLTHPHSDHFGGMSTVFKSYGLKNYIDPMEPDTTEDVPSNYTKWISTVKTMVTADHLYMPAEDKLSKTSSMPVEFFGPDVKAEYIFSRKKFVSSNVNTASIIFRLTYGGTSMIFTGDATSNDEAEIVSKYRSKVQSNFLKVCHHGSSTSSSKSFLDAIWNNISKDKRGAYISSGRRAFSGSYIPEPTVLSRFVDGGYITLNQLYSTSAGDDAKVESEASRDDNILIVIYPDGSYYSCYSGTN